MNARALTFALTLGVCYALDAGEATSTNRLSWVEDREAIAIIVEDLRRTGVLEDLTRFGLITNSVDNVQWPELMSALWKLKIDHPPLGTQPGEWMNIPPPDLKGTSDPSAVQDFIRTNGWNMHNGRVGLNWGLVKTKPIKGLPWERINHREFQAATANGILYVVIDGFHHNCYGVAYNPKTNRFDSAIRGFTPIGDHWYAWSQPEELGTLLRQYEGNIEPASQQTTSERERQPSQTATNKASKDAGSDRLP